MLMTHQVKKKKAVSARFMINGVKKLEFIFKTLVAHTETINPIYWAPTIHQPKNPKNQHKISERSNNYYKTLILLCVSLLKRKKENVSNLPWDFLGVTFPKQIQLLSLRY